MGHLRVVLLLNGTAGQLQSFSQRSFALSLPGVCLVSVAVGVMWVSESYSDTLIAVSRSMRRAHTSFVAK